MHIGENGRSSATPPSGVAQTRKPWLAPVLILEDVKYATETKINNPVEFTMFGTTEGPVS